MREPTTAIITSPVFAMLSLAGIPPMAGFFAKYYIFTAALQQHYTGLVILAVVGSLIGVYYYFRIIIAMFKTESEGLLIPLNAVFKIFLLAMSLATLILGLMPQLVVGLF